MAVWSGYGKYKFVQYLAGVRIFDWEVVLVNEKRVGDGLKRPIGGEFE